MQARILSSAVTVRKRTEVDIDFWEKAAHMSLFAKLTKSFCLKLEIKQTKPEALKHFTIY